MLRHLKRVVVQFKPGDPKSVSARELLQRLSGDRAKKSNPQCKVEFAIDEEAPMGKSFVELHFADDDVRKIYMADQKVQVRELQVTPWVHAVCGEHGPSSQALAWLACGPQQPSPAATGMDMLIMTFFCALYRRDRCAQRCLGLRCACSLDTGSLAMPAGRHSHD